MNIALLGGAFNPPHIGHIFIAIQILDYTDTDEVWYLPNYKQTPPKPVEGVSHRLEMTRLIVFPKTKVSTLEIDHRLDGETVNILPLLPQDHAFSFVIGSDQLPTFHLWQGYEKLLKNLPFYVFPRYGYPNEPLYTNMTVINHQDLITTNISSTKIRERIAHNLPIEHFVPDSVSNYIHTYNLYRSTK